MEDTLVGLLGVAGTVIVGLLGLLFVQRRNGRNHSAHQNPNFETLEVLLQQILKAQQDNVGKQDKILTALTAIQTTIKFCPTVQATEGRRG